MALNSRTRNGWGHISANIGNEVPAFPAGPKNIRIVIAGNDSKQVFSLSAGYTGIQQDPLTHGILTTGVLAIVEGRLDEEIFFDPATFPELFWVGNGQTPRILFMCPISGVTPFHALFSDRRTIESSEMDNITIILSSCYRATDIAGQPSQANAFLNAFGIVEVAGIKRDFSEAYEIR